MNEENKFKIIFGNKLSQKEFFDLQNESKLLKPASMRKLLGKRSWKIDQKPGLEKSDNFNTDVLNQSKKRKRKLTRSNSFSEETSAVAITQENDRQPISPLPNIQERNRKNVAKSEQQHEQVNVGRTDLTDLPNADNYEDFLAYHLRSD